MAKSGAKHLKLFSERPPEAFRLQPQTLGSLGAVFDAYRRTTGWSLDFQPDGEARSANGMVWSAPVGPSVGALLGQLRLDRAKGERAAGTAPIDREDACDLAAAIGGLVDELVETRHALWRREAELAAGVPLVSQPDEEEHLAARLQAVLKGGAEAVGCRAAALYLLDEATTELKLRSSWGLPAERMIAPARPLRGAVADLEALLGHAVVLSDSGLMKYWKVPEEYPAAVCVPVSSPTSLLGTLWVYCGLRRDFNDRETNILEVVAGRIAADLEREMLLREGIDAARWRRQLGAAEQLQQNQLPAISPLLAGWDVAGWTLQSESIGGDFYDWFCLPDGLLAAAVGDAMDQGLRAAMASSALKAALRAHGQYHRQADTALKKLNLTLWTGSAGDQRASLFYGLVETATGRVCCASAGQAGVVLVRQDGWTSLSHPSPALGEGPDTPYEPFGCELRPGEALVAFTDGFHDAADREGRRLGEAGVAEPMVGQTHLSADDLVALARRNLNAHVGDSNGEDRTILVIKRTEA